MRAFIRLAAFAAFSGAGAPFASAQINIPTVLVGHGGNAPDSFTDNLYGSVPQPFLIGATEVTNAQYAAFLNAVAATDTFGLYSSGMADPFGGIIRSGSPGAYTYATIAGRADQPVNSVSFYDAIRFVNWLHNGQPTGGQNNSTTENGAYLLTANLISANSVARSAGWRWALTSENEWYKAAYHQPASEGGDGDNYWLYPTSSNTINTSQANYGFTHNGPRPVGSYAPNFYGTFDMGGNVSEWNESVVSGSLRGFRGGANSTGVAPLASNTRNGSIPAAEGPGLGFRVVQSCAPVIASQPSNATICPGGTATLSVGASGPTLTYQWQWQPAGPGTAWAALSEGTNLNTQGSPAFEASGATDLLVSIQSLSGLGGDFRCFVTTVCDSVGVTSNEATLTVCPPDINCDGSIDPDDLSDYIACFFATPPCPRADVNGDGNTDPDDLSDYIALFFTGC